MIPLAEPAAHQDHLYEVHDAESWSQNSVNFLVRSAAPNLVVSPQMYIVWYLKFTGSDIQEFYAQDYNGDGNGARGGTPDRRWICTRACFPASRMIDSVRTVINDKSSFFHVPRYYQDALSRMYITEKQSATMSSGGPFDSGDMGTFTEDDQCEVNVYSRNLAAVITRDGVTNEITNVDTQLNFTTTTYPIISSRNAYDMTAAERGYTRFELPAPLGDNFINPAIRKRKIHLYHMLNAENEAQYNANYDVMAPDNNIEMQFAEPVPITPFSAFPKFMNGQDLSYMQRVHIQMQLCGGSAEKAKRVFQWRRELAAENVGGGLNSAAVDIKCELSRAPVLLIKYKKRDVIAPPRQMLSWTQMATPFTVDRTDDAVKLEGQKEFVYDLMVNSERIYFYIRKNNTSEEEPTEHFLGIEKMIILTQDVRHELHSRQLYQMYREEAINKDLSYLNWRKTKSVVVLNCKQLRLAQRIRVIVTWRNYWKLPTLGMIPARTYDNNEVLYEAIMLHGQMVEVQV